MFKLHLPEKYDGSVNPAKFLQIDTTSILAAGGNGAIMANYFLVGLTSTARSWLINMPPRSPFSKEELCGQFTSCNNTWGNHCAPSSSGSPRFTTLSHASPMLLLLLHFDRV
jgi:hypothetical protein